jgi:3-keto-disaccharide hydrolase
MAMRRAFGLVWLAGLSCLVFVAISSGTNAVEESWMDLTAGTGFSAWRKPAVGWELGGDAAVSPENPKRIAPKPGTGVLINGPIGKAANLISAKAFGDVEFHCEFMVPSKSNSGVKFEGLYEIQIADSWGVKEPKASDCGGIYPRAELLPTYHHIDDGFPPRTNASRQPGEWQTLDVVFQNPRFGADGKKTTNARFVKVLLNGQVIHENVDVPYPTGNAWHDKEPPTGPILLQGDHGPVAFRNVRVRPWRQP